MSKVNLVSDNSKSEAKIKRIKQYIRKINKSLKNVDILLNNDDINDNILDIAIDHLDDALWNITSIKFIYEQGVLNKKYKI
jgi:hypothetical protein